ncbi:MAG: TIR domain-containing protein [Actinomycetota bacterium]|nr:TIR domain-containing protein [Actinomycetota bacterium]
MPTYDQRRRLGEAVQTAERKYELAKSSAKRTGRPTPIRHKCFISYHGADIEGVTDFVEDFNEVFIPRVVGVSDSDHFKDPVTSQDEEYIKSQIGTKYLSDSTVTILYVGKCTWARRYVDWELSSSLRNSKLNKRNGLLAITPADRSTGRLPERFSDNWTKGNTGYARYYYYPRRDSSLRDWIEDAFEARKTRMGLIDNRRRLRQRNSRCP